MSFYLQTLRRMRKSVLVTWLFTYLIVLLIPIFANLFNSFYLKRMIRDEIENANIMLLDAVKNNLDKVLHDIVSISNIIYLDKRLSDTYIIPYGAPSYTITASACMDLLKTLINNNDQIDILIYLPEQNFIITPSTANSSETIYSAYENSYGEILPYEDWITILSSYYSYNFSVRPHLSYKNFNTDSVVFARTIPSASTEGRYANIFVSIPFESFTGINQEFRQDANIGIFTPEGDKLHQSVAPFIPSKLDFDMESGQRFINYEYDKVEYVCSYSESSVIGWIYALFMPTEIFWQKYSYVNMSITISVGLALLIGMISVVAVIRKNYRSVSSVLTLINESTPGQNEFSLIAEAYKSVDQENSLIKDSISSQKSNLRDMYFFSILKGIDNGFVNLNFDILELDINGDCYGLISIMFNNVNKTFSNENDDHYEYNDIMTFAVNNVFDELFFDNDKFIYNMVKDGKYLVFLFQIMGDGTEWEKESCILLNRMYDFFKLRLGSALVIVLTKPYKSLEETHKHYLSLLETFEYASSIGLVGLIKADANGDYDSGNLKFVDQDELFAAIRNGSSDAAETCLGRLFEGMGESNIPFRIIQARVFNILSVIFEAFYKTVPLSYEKNHKLQHALSRTMVIDNIGELYTETVSLVNTLCQTVTNYSNSKPKSVNPKRVREYIDRNYTNHNLNVSSIMEALNLENKNISKEFRDETSMGILDYITHVRITHAKQIMAEQNVTVEEVALSVGYTNERTFRRAFAKVEGVTPSKYGKNVND